jgi:hypothetical protein
LSLLSKIDIPWFLNWGKTSCYTHHTFLLGFPTGWLSTTHEDRLLPRQLRSNDREHACVHGQTQSTWDSPAQPPSLNSCKM